MVIAGVACAIVCGDALGDFAIGSVWVVEIAAADFEIGRIF